MSNPPPGDSDEASESAAQDNLRGTAARVVATAVPFDSATELRPADIDAAAAAVLFEDEAAASPTDKKRAARFLHEVAHLREGVLGQPREAAKTYAQSLTLDPTFQPNGWALRRMFQARGLWENLVRLIDAEIRFAPLPGPADRADLWVERGRILEDRLNRDADARASYRSALEAAPNHAAACLALLVLGLRTGAPEDAESALSGLVSRVTEPQQRALLAVELARLQRGSARGGVDPEKAGRAADGLFKILNAGAAPGPVLRELDRLSLILDKPDLRLKVLDAFDSRLSRESRTGRLDAPLAVGLYREKARILLRRGARDAALAVLERALALAPTHPLLALDFLDVAEEAGRADAIAALLGGANGDGSHLDPDTREEVLLRRAEVAARSGAWGEAIGSLDRISDSSRVAPLARLVRQRVLTLLGDGDGLAKALADQATSVLGDDPTAASPASRLEAVHLLSRAGAVRAGALKDAAGAEILFVRALAILPGYRPATEGLAALLAATGRWRELADLFAAEHTRADDDERRRELGEALVMLHRDLLGEPAAALARQKELAAGSADMPAFVRLVDLAGATAPGDPSAAEAALDGLRTLESRVSSPEVKAALALLGARLGERDGGSGTSLAVLEQAFREDPLSTAGAALEQLAARRGDPHRRREIVTAELVAAEKAGNTDRARALRYRLAWHAAKSGGPEDALLALAPLRATGEAMAHALSLDFARAAGRADLEARLLSDGDPGGGVALPADILPPADRALWRGEALEAMGDRPAAREAFRVANDGEPGGWEGALDAAFNLHQAHAAADDTAGVVAALRRLAALLADGPLAHELRREAEMMALSAGLPSGEPPVGKGAADAVWDWLSGARAGDRGRVFAGLERLASEVVATPETAALWTSIAAGRAFAGLPGAAEALARATAVSPATVAVTVAATDLAQGAHLEDLPALRRSRADRLVTAEGRTDGAIALAEALWLEDADEALARAHPKQAATALQRVLASRPDSIEATEGVARVLRCYKDRMGEAAALARQGDLLRAPRRAAERYVAAAAICDDEGRSPEAAALYRRVLARVPDHEHASRRLTEILDRSDDAPGLEILLGFKLQRAVSSSAKAGLLIERAKLRAQRLGKRRDAISDFRRVLVLSPGHIEALRTLARLATEDRLFSVAAGFYEEALRREKDEVARVALAMELAAVYDELDRADAALAMLTLAIEIRPENPEPRERVIAMALRRHDFERAITELQALEALAGPDEGRANLRVRLGRLHLEKRDDPAAALAAFRGALELDPLGEAAAELSRLSPARIALSAADAEAVRRVLVDIRRRLVEADPLDVVRLERTRDLARLRGDLDLAEAAAQTLATVGVGNERGRPRDFVRPLTPAGLASLATTATGTAAPGSTLLFELWPHLAEAVARTEKLDLGALGATRHTKVAPGSDRRVAWIEAAIQALGMKEVDVFVGGTDDLGVLAVDAPDRALIVGRAVLGGDAGSRFRVGRGLALMWQRATTIDRRSSAELELLVHAAGALAGANLGTGFDPTVLKAASKNLSKHLARKDSKGLAVFGPRFAAELLDVADWRAGMVRAANRFGLLAAGDVTLALRSLLGQTSPGLAALRSVDALDLIRFALSERYGVLRRETGLASMGQP